MVRIGRSVLLGLTAVTLAAGPAAPAEVDKCGTLRAQVESVIGTTGAAPVRSYAPQQDMPSLTCLYRSDSGWLTITFTANPDRGQFERFAALVPGIARVDGLAEVAFTVPPTPQQRPAGATIAAYQAGTQFTIEAASNGTTSDQLMDGVKGIARTVASDDRLLHGTDQQPAENQHLQGGG